MNANKVRKFRSELEKAKNALLGDVEKNLRSSKEVSSEAMPDIADDASRSYARQLMLNLGEQDWERLKLIEEALEKINTGDFGICQECHKPIPEARLNVVPFAKYCVVCLDEIEKSNARTKEKNQLN